LPTGKVETKFGQARLRGLPDRARSRKTKRERGGFHRAASLFLRNAVRRVFEKKIFMKKINPKKLFSSEILNFPVKIKRPGKVRYVNLDNAATTPPFFTVEKEIKKYLESYGSVHRGAGIKSKISTDVYENTREIIKNFVNAPKDAYVMFSGNTTGAMNMAAYFFSFLPGKVAVSEIEHSSSYLPWVKAEGEKELGNERVCEKKMEAVNDRIQKSGLKNVVKYSLSDDFEFDLNDIENIFKKNKIKAFVLTASSNVTGYCPPIKKIGKLVHKYGAYFIVDACQFIQHHKIDMKKDGIDFLAASGHKFYAPYGGGFLIGPKKFLDKFLPYQIGGGNLPYIAESGEFIRYKNQLAHDPGTPNALGAVSMAIALEKLQKLGLKNVEAHEKRLARKAFDYLKKNKRVKLYVSEKHLNTVLPFNIIGMEPKKVAEILNEKYGIGVRAGSFCSYSLVKKLLGIKNEKQIILAVKREDVSKIPGFVRASISLCNNDEDIARFIAAVGEITREEIQRFSN